MAGNLGSRIARVDVIIGGVQQAKAQLKEMEAQMKQYAESAEKAREAMLASTNTVDYDRHKADYEKASKDQKQLERAIRLSQQNINTVDKYLQDISGQTLRNLQAARRTMQQALLSVDPKDTEGLETVRGFITQIADEIKRRKGEIVEFSDIIGDIGNVSDRSLGMAKQRLQDLIASTKLNADEMKKYREQLRQVEEEQQRRVSSQAGKVMGNLSGSSLNEIQEAVRTTTQLRDAQKLGSEEWEIYNDEIQRAQKYLADFNNLGKQLAMSDRMKELGKASTDSLAELRKFWQEQVDGAERGSLELAEYEKNLKRVTVEQQRRSEQNAYDVTDNLNQHTVREIQDATKALEQLRYSTERGDSMWYAYTRRIDAAREHLERFARMDKEASMSARMQDLGTASNDSLAELRKFWQEQVDGAKYASEEMRKYQEQLRTVQDEEQRRISSRAQTTMGSVQAGTFDGTIAETREAIKLIEQYKQQLKTSDTKGIRDADEAIQALNDRIRQATTATMSMKDALDRAATVGQGSFAGTYEDLQRLKQTLEEYQKQLKVGDAEGLEKIQRALRDIDKAQKDVSQGTVDINSVMKNLRAAPLEQLQKAAAQLQRELTEAERGTEAYIKSSAQLRQVNAQIDRVKKSWEQHDSQIVATAKRLTSYVLVYAGFNEVVGRIKQLTTANLELSDALADIQKTTGLSAESVGELSREIDSIDTRTAQSELNALAYEAGKLGISAKEDVLGFVKAGNELLVALGEDLGGAEAVRELMKVNAILGETSKLGIEKALKATGSAINEISQTSRADAGPIVDIVSRIGAIGQAAGMSMSDLVALGGTIDALGQHAEVGGTAMNTFISTLTSNTTEVAQAVGLSDEYLKSLINQGKTMEAIIAVFEKMNAMGGLDVLAPLMKDLGSDGERIKQVLVTLSSGVDELKAQVFTSAQAFKEATSVTDEYNIKNESAMAIVLRMGNAIKESLVNSGVVEWLTDVLRWMASVPDRFARGELGIRGMAAALQVLVGVLIASSKAVQEASLRFLLFFDGLKNGTRSVNIFKASWEGLSKAFKMNPLGWIITAASLATSAMTMLAKSVDEAAKAHADFESTLAKERFELDNLRYAIEHANVANGERASLIQQLNGKYGSYLGFLVTENNYMEKQEYIYRLINAQLRETLALKMRDRMESNITEKYADQIQEVTSALSDQLKEMKNIGETNLGDAMSIIMDGIHEAVEEGGSLYDVIDKLEAKYGKAGQWIYTNTNSLLEIFKSIREEAGTTQTILEGAERASKRQSESLMRADLQKSNKGILSSSDLGKLNTYLQQATTYVQRLRADVDGLNEKREKGYELSTEETNELEEKNRQLGVYQHNISQVEKRIRELGMQSVWGQGLELETAGVDKLVATYKRLEAAMKSINEDKDYAATFASRGFKSAQEEYQALKKMEEDVAKVLRDKWGRDTSGNWLKEKGSGRSKSYSYNGAIKTAKEIKEESTAALSALEAYFNKEKELINRAYLDEEITEEEKNARLLKKEEEFLRDRVALRQRLLGRKGGENFNQEKYVHTDTVTGETTNYFEGKDLDQLSGFIKQMGQAMTDGILNQLTIDELKIQQAMVEHMKKIQKIILDNDFTGQTDKQYQDQLEALELFWGKTEEVTKEGADKRLAYLRMLSKDSYEMDWGGLKKRMKNYDEFSEWMKKRNDEDYQALLILLQKYYDDTEEAENREIARRQRLTDRKWEKTGQKKSWEDTEEVSEHEVTFMSSLQGLGLASDDMVDDAELSLYQTRLAAAQAYYEFVQENGGNLLEAEQKRNEAMVELSQKEMEITKEKLETLKSYTDAVVDFAGQMGEAAFGEVSDRKEAAKQLLQTTMKLTKDLIMQKVTELIMKQALNKQEVAQEQATQASVQATKGATEIANLTATGAKMAGDVAGGIASGGAKTVGELGWWGIPLIAVISAALSALMGMAMGKINQAKQEVAAATGASNKGRVAAGMLTYAEGDYPVLGNDGHIYNARYQKELKTGVYRGGAHFGIFSEKKPEMIVDGDTTQKLVLNYPHIYESILTIARHGRLKSAAMPTFAAGSYPDLPAGTQAGQTGAAADASGQDSQMQQTLAGLQTAVAALTRRLNQPINATMDPYNANKQLKKTDKFMQKRGLIK